MRKFTYSRQIETPEGVETFTASEFDSFEEGQKAVDKGIYDRKLNFPRPSIMETKTPPPLPPTKNETGTGAKTE